MWMLAVKAPCVVLRDYKLTFFFLDMLIQAVGVLLSLIGLLCFRH